MIESQVFIGWDVGGWNCDKNPRSRDALVILDQGRNILGVPWRGNLRTTINHTNTSRDWLRNLFALRSLDAPAGDVRATLAIDTPLGFSRAFLRLAGNQLVEEELGQSKSNPYLYRETERFLFDHGYKPLSTVKDMIGSQATTAMHALARFTPRLERIGVWSDAGGLTTIEAYPAACKGSERFDALLEKYVVGQQIDPYKILWTPEIDHQDKLDALICALVAYVYTIDPDALAAPLKGLEPAEGWIWAPKDALQTVSSMEILEE